MIIRKSINTRVYMCMCIRKNSMYMSILARTATVFKIKKKLDIKICWTGRKLEIKKFPRLRIRARRKTLILEVVVKRI